MHSGALIVPVSGQSPKESHPLHPPLAQPSPSQQPITLLTSVCLSAVPREIETFYLLMVCPKPNTNDHFRFLHAFLNRVLFIFFLIRVLVPFRNQPVLTG